MSTASDCNTKLRAGGSPCGSDSGLLSWRFLGIGATIRGSRRWRHGLGSGPSPNVLSNERLRASLAIRDWILGEAREIGDPNIILEGVSLMMRDAGVPIDRATSAVELRHAERAANARIWEFGSSAREHLYAHERGSDASGKRPLAEAHRLNDWVFTWLPDTPDDAYDIVAPLKAAGYTHHIAAPVILPNGMHNGFTFATRAPAGFSEQDIAMLRSIFPTLAALQEVLALNRVMREVMRMYVGNEPHLTHPVGRCPARRGVAHPRRNPVRRHAGFHPAHLASAGRGGDRAGQ